MPEASLAARSALDRLAEAGRLGKADQSPGLTVEERCDLGLATVMVRLGQVAVLGRTIRRAYGIEPPSAPRYVPGHQLALAWAGPDHWLAVSNMVSNGDLAAELAQRLKGLASVSDQSSGRMVLRLSGPCVRTVLAKGVPLDLHPRAFGPGYAAVTAVAGIGVHLWQLDGEPTYELAVPRGFAASFWRWLAAAAVEFGFAVR